MQTVIEHGARIISERTQFPSHLLRKNIAPIEMVLEYPLCLDKPFRWMVSVMTVVMDGYGNLDITKEHPRKTWRYTDGRFIHPYGGVQVRKVPPGPSSSNDF